MLKSLLSITAVAVTAITGAEASTRSDVVVVYTVEAVKAVTIKDHWGHEQGAIFTKMFAWPYPLYMCVWPTCGPPPPAR